MKTVVLLVTVLVIELCSVPAMAFDADNNGIDDETEYLIAMKYRPSFKFHVTRVVEPEPVEIMSPTGGALTLYDLWNSFYSVASQSWILATGYDSPPSLLSQPYSFGRDEAEDPYLARPDGLQFVAGNHYLDGNACSGGGCDLYLHFQYGEWGDELSNRWRDHYINGSSMNLPGSAFDPVVYPHLFLDEYGQCVIQYWIFYPYNNSINNHEGDWEHINVVLSGPDATNAEILAIDFYIHERYMVVDGDLLEYVHYVDQTHPVIYVGGYGALTAGGITGVGDESGGSYPALGDWVGVGSWVPDPDTSPLAVWRPHTETVSEGWRYLNYRDVGVVIYPRIDRHGISGDEDGCGEAYFQEHPELAWMRCNAFWGQYITGDPWVTHSPFVQWTTNIGNRSPLTPAYQATWERRFQNGFERYYRADALEGSGAMVAVSAVVEGRELHGVHFGVTQFIDGGSTPWLWEAPMLRGLPATVDSFWVDAEPLFQEGEIHYVFDSWIDLIGPAASQLRRKSYSWGVSNSFTANYKIRRSFEDVSSSVLAVSDGIGGAWGDYDGDGRVDLALILSDRTLGLYRNEGGVFAAVEVPSVEHVHHVVWVDYDKDGDLDLAVVGGEHYAYNLMLHNDSGTFIDTYLPAAYSNMGRTSWCDVDGDGDMDGAVAGSSTLPGNAMLVNGGGYFSIVEGAIPAVFEDIAWGDFDGDGDYDIFRLSTWAYPLYDSSFLLVNDGSGIFDFAEDFPPANQQGAFAACWSDFDNDSLVDLFVDGRLYLNRGGDWALVQSVVQSTGNAVAGDFDNDGWIDLFYGGRLYRNEQGYLVDETGRGWYSGFNGTWDFVDIDDDGKPDLVSIDGTVKIYRNIDDNSNRLCRVSLHGSLSGARGEGAVVSVGGATQWYVQGSGYAGNQYTGSFGLGDVAGDVPGWVRWPSGLRQEFLVPAGATIIDIDERIASFTSYIDRSKTDDGSGAARLPYEALPYSSVTVDFDGAGPRDMVVSMLNDRAQLYAASEMTVDGGIPEYFPYQEAFAVGSEPSLLLGLSVADVNGDGNEEMFGASQTAPRLYQLQGSAYVNMASTWGVAPAALLSTTGAWADFDRDGDVDLAIGTSDCGAFEPGVYNAGPPVHDVLLRNDLNTAGTFTDVSVASGLQPDYYSNSTTVTWGDVNDDGFPDLFVGEFGEPATGPPHGIDCRLFVNQMDGTFIDVADSLIGAHMALFTIGAVWRDMDNDGALDLELANKTSRESLRFDRATGLFAIDISEDDGNYSGLRVFDHDLDGVEDVLLLPSVATDMPRLLAGSLDGFSPTYTNVTAATGLAIPGKIGGAIAADLNGDGDIDLFLGREPEKDAGGAYVEGDQYLFQAKSQAGTVDAPANNWLSIRLQSPSGMNNRMGIGAKVRVYDSGRQRVRMVDGGSGRGGQDDPTMVFGLGAGTTVDSVTVDWPNGFRQVLTGAQLNISTGAGVSGANMIEDASAFGSPMCAVASQIEFVPQTQLIDWFFSWTTDLRTNPDLDMIVFDTAGMTWECQEGLVPLTKDTPGVEASTTILPDGRMRHDMVWRNRPCVPCTIKYRAYSGINSNEGISSLGQRTVRYCLSN